MTKIIDFIQNFSRNIFQENYNDINNTLVDYIINGEIIESKFQPICIFYTKIYKDSKFITCLTTWPNKNHLSQYLKYQIKSVTSKTQISELDLIAIYLEKIETEIDRLKDTDKNIINPTSWKTSLLKTAKIILNKELLNITDTNLKITNQVPDSLIQVPENTANPDLEPTIENTSAFKNEELKSLIDDNLDTIKSELENDSKDMSNLSNQVVINNSYTDSEIKEYKIRVKLCQEIKEILSKLGLINQGDREHILHILADFFKIPIDVRGKLKLNQKNKGNSIQYLNSDRYNLTNIFKTILHNTKPYIQTNTTFENYVPKYTFEKNAYLEIEIDEYNDRARIVNEILFLMIHLGIIEEGNKNKVLDNLADFLEIPNNIRDKVNLYLNIAEQPIFELTPINFTNTKLYKIMCYTSNKQINKMSLNINKNRPLK